MNRGRPWPYAFSGMVLLLALAVCPPLAAQQPAAGDGSDPGAGEPQFNANGLRLEAEAAFDGRVQSNSWACAVIEIENIGEPIDGLLVIEGEASASTGESTRYTRAIDVGRKARKRVFLYFKAEGWSSEWLVQLHSARGGVVLAETVMRTTAKEEGDVTVAVVGQDPMGIQAIRETWPGAVPGHPTVSTWHRRRVVLALTPPEQIPDRWVGYRTVDVLVWSQPDPTGLSDEQVAAIGHYVSLGGTLVVTVTDGWQGVRDSTLADLLPVTLHGAVEVEQIDALAQGMQLSMAGTHSAPILTADAEARDDTVTVRAQDGQRVLWAERSHGLGRVIFIGVDPAMYPIRGAVDREAFWRRALWMPEPPGGQRGVGDTATALAEELTGGGNVDPSRYASGGGPFALEADPPLATCVHDMDNLGTASTTAWATGSYYGSSAIDTWYNAVRQKLVDIPALQPLPLGWILLFAVVYLLAIGPVDFLLLKAIGRQEWTWITFPLLIMVFFTAAVIGTTAAKGRKAVMTRLEVVDVFEPEGVWRGQSYVGIFASQRTALTLQSEHVDSVVEPMRIVPISTWWGADPMDEGYMKRPQVQVGLGGGALAYRSDTWTFAYLQSAWVTTAAGHFLLRSDGDGRVSVINDSGIDLVSAMVLVGPAPGLEVDAYSLGYASQYSYDGLLQDGNQVLGANFHIVPLGPLMTGSSAQIDLDQAPEQAQPAWPMLPERVSVHPTDTGDWDQLREMPGGFDRRGHLDLTRMLLDHQLVLVGFASKPIEDFELTGLDPVSEPRTLVRIVLGPDPRTPPTTEVNWADPGVPAFDLSWMDQELEQE